MTPPPPPPQTPRSSPDPSSADGPDRAPAPSGGRVPVALPILAGSVGLAQAVLLMLIPVLVAHTGIDLFRLSLAMAAGTALFLVGAPLWGRWSDRMGRRRAMILIVTGQAAAAAAFVAAIFATAGGALTAAQGFAALLAARVAHGLTASGILPVSQAWVADLTPATDRLRQFGRLSAGANAGRVLGPVLAAAFVGLGALGPLHVLLVAAGAALVAVALTGPAPARHPPPQMAGPEAKAPGRLRAEVRMLVPFLVMAHAMHTAFGLLQYSTGLMVQDRLGLSAAAASATLGVMLALAAAAMIAVQILILPRLRGRTTLALGLGAAGLCGAGLVVAVAATLPAFLTGVVLFGCASALLVPANAAACSASLPADRQGAAIGHLTGANTLGYATGALVAGAVSTVNLEAAPALAALVGGGLVLAIVRRAARRWAGL